MSDLHTHHDLEARVNELIDDRLFEAFWSAAKHFNTTDLVVCFDDSQEEDPVSIFVREKLVQSSDVPSSLRAKLSNPAKEAKFQMGVSETVFWFVPMFRDGGMACVAINAKQLAPGDHA
jgi:hypothetical protein